jgi:hypothetical protein
MRSFRKLASDIFKCNQKDLILLGIMLPQQHVESTSAEPGVHKLSQVIEQHDRTNLKLRILVPTSLLISRDNFESSSLCTSMSLQFQTSVFDD